MVVGPRGVGKTVLLCEVASRAGATYGWPWLHVEVEAHRPFTPALLFKIAALESALTEVPAGRRFRASEAVLRAQLAGLGGEVQFARDPVGLSTPLELQQALTKLVEAARARDSGFVLTVDELQLADGTELSPLAAALQHATRESWPVVVAGAGLPGMRDPSRSITYFERSEWFEIGILSESDTVLALSGPAEEAGRPLDDDAAHYLARCSGGYPYAVQLYGHHAWRASTGQDSIDLEAARSAEATARVQLEHGLYANRWAQTPQAERRYLAAAAEVAVAGGPVTGRAVAAHLGVPGQRLSVVRARLIHRGTLTAEGEVLNFAVPGMATYVLRRFRAGDGDPPTE